MAENPDGQEKTEDPTDKKKSQASEKGQVPRSQDLTTFFMMVVSIIGLTVFAEDLVDTISKTMRTNFMVDRTTLFDTNQLILYLKSELSAMIWALLPFFILLFFTVILSGALLGGFNFASSKLKPTLKKLNPIKGLKKIFGKGGLIELAKSILKIGFLGTIAVFFIWQAKNELYGLSAETFPGAFVHALELVAKQFFYVALGLIVIAIIDVIYQVWTHKQQLKMTKQEVKDESKNTDGNPVIKKRIRQVQYEMAMQRMMSDVPKADVIITNPTHYAVALRYDPEGSGAPVVLAKGVDLVALKIRSVAKSHDIPLLEMPPLARAIYHSVEIGEEIPAGLYIAVAQVLAYIFQLRNGEIDANMKPDLSDLPIPSQYRH